MNRQQSLAEWESPLHLFRLEGLLPAGQALSVDTTYLILSLVSLTAVNSNPILLQRPLSEVNMRLLLPLLAMPGYCPHEILHASLFCSYKELLAGLFSSEPTAKAEWQATVKHHRDVLQQAHISGRWKKELKSLYKALSDLRAKLRAFGLTISILASHSAYALMALPPSD